MLVPGQRIVHANALINLGPTGDFLNSCFANQHSLTLHNQRVSLTCISFNGSLGLGGIITHS